jgi:hypothetical protein
MTYTNQLDHPILDRQSIRELLVQLTSATVEAAPTLGTCSEHLERLERQAGSTLEKKWLAFIEGHGYRLPTHAQRLFAEAGTRPDFFYGERPTSSPQAGEFLLKERMVLHALLLAFQPRHVALNPRVVAFGYKARESLRVNEVHQSCLGTLPKYTHLPVLSLLMAMLTVC